MKSQRCDMALSNSYYVEIHFSQNVWSCSEWERWPRKYLSKYVCLCNGQTPYFWDFNCTYMIIFGKIIDHFSTWHRYL